MKTKLHPIGFSITPTIMSGSSSAVISVAVKAEFSAKILLRYGDDSEKAEKEIVDQILAFLYSGTISLYEDRPVLRDDHP